MDNWEYVAERKRIEEQIEDLRNQLQIKENELKKLNSYMEGHTLTSKDIIRYSRQIIVPGIGVKGQEKLKRASVLIIGCGGLGCPAAQYLAGAGIGRLGLVDYDVVEESNLHRQILHGEDSIGVFKVSSMAKSLWRLNSNIVIDEYHTQLNSSNALTILSQYDVVLDASDNVATRYLINDACVMCEKPLISGSAVKTEGQLTVYHFNDEGPCYRCLFPEPPPPFTVANCGDVGVLGPVPGVIGTLQALQAIHIITGEGNVLSRNLLMFDARDFKFRTIKLRAKMPDCKVCGISPIISKLIDYEQFCQSPAQDKNPNLKVLTSSERKSPAELLKDIISSKCSFQIIDVRSPSEFDMCHLPNSINIPLKEMSNTQNKLVLEEILDKKNKNSSKLFVVCRRGNDSQLAVKQIKDCFGPIRDLFDIRGGLHAWSKSVDPSFPVY